MELLNTLATVAASLGGMSLVTFLFTRSQVKRESAARALGAEAETVERIDKIWRERVEELTLRISQLEKMVSEQTDLILTLRRQLAGLAQRDL